MDDRFYWKKVQAETVFNLIRRRLHKIIKHFEKNGVFIQLGIKCTIFKQLKKSNDRPLHVMHTHPVHAGAVHAHAAHAHIMHAHAMPAHIMHARAVHTHAMHNTF